MAITDHFTAYDFDNTGGPGCGVEHHPGECLCDVRLGIDHVEVSTITEGPLHRIATHITHSPRTPAQLERWASELLGLHGAVEDKLAEADRLDRIRQQLMLKILDPGRVGVSKNAGRYAWRSEVHELLQAGLTLVQIAAFVGVHVEDICRCLGQGRSPVAAYLRAEEVLRSGRAESLGHVERETGLSRYVVRKLAEAIGVQTRTDQRLKGGGGYSYSAEQHDEVVRLRQQGLSYGQIEKATGIDKTTAFRIVKKAAA